MSAVVGLSPRPVAATGRTAIGGESGADPEWEWDVLADPVAAAIVDRGDTAAVNAALHNWTTNGQVLPAGLPGYVSDFIEAARQLPDWADPAKLRAATDFTKRRGTYLGVLYGFGSGLMSTTIPREARAVYYSKGGANMKDRIAKTSKLGYDIGALNAYQPNGSMVVTAVKTRLVHAAVRHLLPQSPGWSKVTNEKVPISQADLLVTWNSLATFSMRKMIDWNIEIPANDADAFLHLWQVSAHMLGVRDEYIPATWDAANTQYAQLLEPVLGPTPEGVELCNTLLGLVAQADGGASRPLLCAFIRYTCGDQIADWLQLPRNARWDRFVRVYWPHFVAAKEGFNEIPLTENVSWTFDEMLRRGVLFFLNDGKPIYITIPDMNRPS